MFLPLLLALKQKREQEENCDALLQELDQRLGRFRGTIRRMVSGQLADEEAILKDSLLALWNAASAFLGQSEGEAVSYVKRVVTHKTLDHIRAARGRLLFVGGATGQASGYETEQDGEAFSNREEVASEGSGEESETPETLVERRQLQALVHEALARLTLPEREVIERVDLQGEQIMHMAARTGEQYTALAKRRIRALRKLKDEVLKKRMLL
jgi:DNA-directed RNA polymerase specialized sigma24 family protein